jgi:hypothetical protein
MLSGDYDRFPLFVDIDCRLEWIERFAPYRDSRVYLRHYFDELAEIPTDVAKRLYRKIETVLGMLQSHRETVLSQIKAEYDKLYQEYLAQENEEFGFQTLSQLLDRYDISFRFPQDGEMTLYEQQHNLVLVPYQKEICVIKRTFLEIFWDERDQCRKEFLVPISDLLPQEIMDIPIDINSFSLPEQEIASRICAVYGEKELSSESF